MILLDRNLSPLSLKQHGNVSLGPLTESTTLAAVVRKVGTDVQ